MLNSVFNLIQQNVFFSSDIKVRLLNLLRKIKSRCQWPLKKLETEKIVLMLFGQMATVRKLINITKSNFGILKPRTNAKSRL